MILQQAMPREVLRPIVQMWTQKIEAAQRSRAAWMDVARQCRMYYNHSAQAMNDPAYTQRFWKGVNPPKFKIAINLAYEYVAIMLPELMWEVPHRNVLPKVPAKDLPPSMFGGEESIEWQMRQMELQQMAQSTDAIAAFMDDWLNYTPGEMDGGGLGVHSELATLDALIVGRGTQWVRPYSMPGSDKRLTGCFYEPPERLLIDPDYRSIHDAEWIALRHVDSLDRVEDRFQLERGSLRNRGSLESARFSAADRSGELHLLGASKDKVIWYEIWSKTGFGSRLSGMDYRVGSVMDEAIGDYAYIAISPGIPFPLNCPAEDLHNGATTEEVARKFAWPIPLWKDNRWPVECLDFYPNTDITDASAAWPIPPLAPALGEINLLNFLIPWITNRTQSTVRDFWAVAAPYAEQLEELLQNGMDQGVIKVPPNLDGDVSKMFSSITQPEMRRDMWQLVELVIDMFRRRTGLMPEKYGQSQTQSRTAEDARNREAAVNIRTEFMRQKVVAYQSRLASLEACVTQVFIRPEDVVGRYGQTGAMAWGKYVTAQDIEMIMRQVAFTISASSIKRPDRERDIANLQEVLQYWSAVLQGYSAQTGNYEPLNGMFQIWARLHDMDVSAMLVPPQEVDEEQQRLSQENAELENRKLEAEAGKLEAEAQAKIMDAMVKAKQSEQGGHESEMKLLGEQAKLLFDRERHEQDLEQDAVKHIVDLAQDRQKFEQDFEQQNAMGKLKLQLAKKPQTNGKR